MTSSLHFDKMTLFEEEFMSVATVEKVRRETLNIRIRPEDRALFDQAARARGKNRTDFILDAARQAAEDALLDRSMLHVSPEAYAEFLALLDAPAQPSERLRRTLQTPLPWDTGADN